MKFCPQCGQRLTHDASGNSVADYNKAIELDPDNADAYYKRGDAYDEVGEYGKAIADYNKAIELDPNDANSYYNRGLAYHEKGEAPAAVSDLEKCIRLTTDPELKEAAQQVLGEQSPGMAIDRNSLLLRVNEKKPLKTRAIESIIGFVVIFVATAVLDFFSYVKTMGSIAWFVAIIGVPLLFFFFSRSRFELNEEGVKFKSRFGRHYLYRWNSFLSYTVDSNNKRFLLKRKGAIGTIVLDSTEKFSEIEQILSERIHHQ